MMLLVGRTAGLEPKSTDPRAVLSCAGLDWGQYAKSRRQPLAVTWVPQSPRVPGQAGVWASRQLCPVIVLKSGTFCFLGWVVEQLPSSNASHSPCQAGDAFPEESSGAALWGQPHQ